MRVPAHKLPKGVNKISRTVKHKDSAKAKARKEKKEEKNNAMSTEDDSATVPLTEEQKEASKMERKKANAHKIAYKKNMLHMTGRNGPRAVNPHSITPTHGY